MLLRRAVRHTAGVALQLIQITRRATHLLNHTLTNMLKHRRSWLYLMIGSFTGCFLDFLGYSVWMGRISVTGSSGVLSLSPKMAACWEKSMSCINDMLRFKANSRSCEQSTNRATQHPFTPPAGALRFAMRMGDAGHPARDGLRWRKGLMLEILVSESTEHSRKMDHNTSHEWSTITDSSLGLLSHPILKTNSFRS